MNQRLVESIAQIILSMTNDERQLLDRKLCSDGLRQLPQSADVEKSIEKSLQIADTEKSLRIAELAQEIHEFEEMYHTPLSELPAESWAIAESESQSPSHRTSDVGESPNGSATSQPNASGKRPSSLFPDALGSHDLIQQLDTDADDSEQPLSSFISLSQFSSKESAQNNHDSYALYDVSTQNGQHQT